VCDGADGQTGALHLHTCRWGTCALSQHAEGQCIGQVDSKHGARPPAPARQSSKACVLVHLTYPIAPHLQERRWARKSWGGRGCTAAPAASPTISPRCGAPPCSGGALTVQCLRLLNCVTALLLLLLLCTAVLLLCEGLLVMHRCAGAGGTPSACPPGTVCPPPCARAHTHAQDEAHALAITRDILASTRGMPTSTAGCVTPHCPCSTLLLLQSMWVLGTHACRRSHGNRVTRQSGPESQK